MKKAMKRQGGGGQGGKGWGRLGRGKVTGSKYCPSCSFMRPVHSHRITLKNLNHVQLNPAGSSTVENSVGGSDGAVLIKGFDAQRSIVDCNASLRAVQRRTRTRIRRDQRRRTQGKAGKERGERAR